MTLRVELIKEWRNEPPVLSDAEILSACANADPLVKDLARKIAQMRGISRKVG